MNRKLRRLQDKATRRENKKVLARKKLDQKLAEYTKRVEDGILNRVRAELKRLGFGKIRLARFENELLKVRLMTNNGESLLKIGDQFIDGFIHRVRIPANEKYPKEVEIYTIGYERRMLACVKYVLKTEFGYGAVRLQRLIDDLNKNKSLFSNSRT